MTVLRYFGIAVTELGISPSEFWGMTLRQFRAALDVRRERRDRDDEAEKRHDLRAALMICKLHNAWMSPKITPWDVFPWLAPEPATDAQILQKFKQFADQYNARIAEA